MASPIAEAEQSPPAPKNEIVDAFRAEIDRWFADYQNFYARTNDAMTQYRIMHVELISTIYNGLMVAFGDVIELVRNVAHDLDDMINDRLQEIGTPNECLQNVMDQRDHNNAEVGISIQNCIIYSNNTLNRLLVEVFYPAFAEIQTQASVVPISVIDVLSRGNVLQDEQEILQYLADRYTAIEMQWLAHVSQVLRWETNRFNTEGLFLGDQMRLCMDEATWQFVLTNSRLEGEVTTC